VFWPTYVDFTLSKIKSKLFNIPDVLIALFPKSGLAGQNSTRKLAEGYNSAAT
jgi:hypothetical protein